MADEKKKIREFEEATTIYEDDYLAIDGNIGKTRKIKPIKIGATYEIEDGDHEFTLVGSNGYEHTVAIPYDNVSMTQAEYNALTEEEKMDGTARFIPDAISTDESELWGRVGRATLETEAQVISNAINELVDKTDETNSDVAELNSSLSNLIKIKNYPLTPTPSSVVTPYSYFTAYQITDIPNTSTIIGLVVLGGDSINPAYARLGSDFVLRIYSTKNEQVVIRVVYI